jgi:glycerophosphoryl diester phosphodiesterase
MQKCFIIIVGILFCWAVFVLWYLQNSWNSVKSVPKLIEHENSKIAHWGGALGEMVVTNSLDSLTSNVHKYNYFEIDFNWTSDNKMVCIHDWEGTYTKSFWSKKTGIPSLAYFESLVLQNKKFKNCTLDTLLLWLEENPEKIIITDIKEKNLDWLREIAKHQSAITRFIPQIYHPNEYDEVRKLWFKKIIWTLYSFSWTNKEVLKSIDSMDLFALTMPRERVEKNFIMTLRAVWIPIYVHTINSIEEAQKYYKKGIDGIYTDALVSTPGW